MAEKVNGQGFGSVPTSGNTRRLEQPDRTAYSSGTESAATSGGTDTVSLTPSAQLLKRLEDLVAAAPSSDTQRIAALKAAISSGAYEIDAQAIADGLIRMETEAY